MSALALQTSQWDSRRCPNLQRCPECIVFMI